MANIADIAKLAGVSKTAVSLYLRDADTKRVGEKTKRQIDKIVQEFQYRPNVVARSLSTRKSYTVGVIMPYNGLVFRNTFLNMLLAGVHSVLIERRYRLLLLPATGDDAAAAVKNQVLMGHGYDGFILFGTRFCTLQDMVQHVLELMGTSIPFVTLNYPEMEYPINQVILRDPPHTSAVQHLLDFGHSRIMLMIGRNSAPDTIAGVEEYKHVLAEYGVPFDSQLIAVGDYERGIAKSELIRKIKAGVSFTAVSCLSDNMAFGVYEALKEYGKKIPADISVVGKHDYFYDSLLDPPLTTVRRQLIPAGERAAQLLLRTIETGDTGRKIFLDSEFILRSSTMILQN
jgi:DNA-binding LacI/PurR family transcriptional regulator